MVAFRDFTHVLPEALMVPSGPTALALALVSLVAVVTVCVYRLWFHPLATFPGPMLYALTDIPKDIEAMVWGTWHKRTLELHRRYGPVVRVGPNSLTFDGSVAWPQIFARQASGIEFGKFARYFGAANAETIISVPREAHRRQRRQLSHAFSEAALVEQQDFVLKYVDIFISRIAQQAHEGQINIVDWLNFLTFDIIGDLGFGEPFHSLARGDYHPWVRILNDSMPGFALSRLADYYPVLKPVFPLFAGQKFIDQLRTFQTISEAKAEARLARGEQPGRRDFITYVNRKTRDGEEGMTPSEKRVTGPSLIIAGSETTAAALAAAFFFLGHNPEALARLRAEIRAAYAAETEVDMKNTAKLPYLAACIEETLRLYPPVTEMPPRISPGAEIEGKFVPKGTFLTVDPYATYRNPTHFADADVFRPERWLPPTHAYYDARYAGDRRAVFNPFSVGPRDCIGKNLAYMEMRLVLARLNLRFDWALAPGQACWLDDQTVLTVWSKPPLWIAFAERADGSLVKA